MRISLVTPSFNKANYIESSICSVLDQNFANLDFGVVDGGSSDGSIELLRRYEDKLSFLIIEPDQGMYDALNKGFARTNGDVMGYLGADDLHFPWTLSVVAEIFSTFPQIEWITSAFPLTADAKGRILRARQLPPVSSKSFYRGANLPGFWWHAEGWIQQESTFWRRSLWERAAGLDISLKYAGDFDLWCRFLKLSEPATVAVPLAAFRRHGQQITTSHGRDYATEALGAFARHGGRKVGLLHSRLSALKRRLRLSSLGRSLHFDFSANEWILREP